MTTTLVLPDSRARSVVTPKNAVWRNGAWWVPVFCGSCGVEGGLVPQENMTFVSWFCSPCFARYGAQTGFTVIPDEVFWERVKQEQIAKYGRMLSAEETVTSLADPESLESRLARDRADLTPRASW